MQSKININQRNRIEILRLLKADGAKSRVDISARMKLTKAAVTLITNEMIQNGIIYEKGIQPKETTVSRGRRKILLEINKNYKLVFGVVFEKDRMVVGLTNLSGQVLDKNVVLIKDNAYRQVLECVVKEISAIMKNNCLTYDRILALGVCISDGGGAFIEETGKTDKLTRIKKDLSHALSMKIVTAPTINAALVAQHLFTDESKKTMNMLVIRYGSQIECGVFVNGEVYSSTNKTAGGFVPMQKRGESNTYLEYCEAHAAAEGDAKNVETERLNRSLSADINVCQTVLDVDVIYVFGDYFENTNRKNEINFILEATYKQPVKVQAGLLSNDTVFLAGCATAVQECFYNQGGIW